jgi:hypothetical protein
LGSRFPRNYSNPEVAFPFRFWRRLDEYRPPGKSVIPAHIIDHIDLASVKARLQRLLRNLHLKYHRSAVRRSHFVRQDGLRLIYFCVPLQEFSAGEDAHGCFWFFWPIGATGGLGRIAVQVQFEAPLLGRLPVQARRLRLANQRKRPRSPHVHRINRNVCIHRGRGSRSQRAHFRKSSEKCLPNTRAIDPLLSYRFGFAEADYFLFLSEKVRMVSSPISN